MNILSWNVREIGAIVKKSPLKKLTSSKSAIFVFIQEIKLEAVEQKQIRACWNQDNLGLMDSPSIGSSGGIFSVWDQNLFPMESSKSERNWIAICGSFLQKISDAR